MWFKWNLFLFLFLIVCYGLTRPLRSQTASMNEMRKDEPQTKMQNKFTIDRIYYINLDKNVGRKQFMDGWLSRQSIPYERVPALVGDPSSCVLQSSDPDKCRGVSGIAMSHIHVFNHLNVTGITLVLEDDYQVINFQRIESALKLVPKDFDIVRFDCWGYVPIPFECVRNENPFIFRTNRTGREKWREVGFCGGMHAAIYKDTSVKKLHGIWSKQPFDDIDCRLTSPWIKSYCINYKGGVGRFDHSFGEVTDIPKNDWRTGKSDVVAPDKDAPFELSCKH